VPPDGVILKIFKSIFLDKLGNNAVRVIPAAKLFKLVCDDALDVFKIKPYLL
jgi:hypothetical protein